MSEKGRFGFILPNKIFRVDYGKEARRIISENSQIANIIDFGSNQVFADSATTYTTLLFLQGIEREKPFTYWKLEDNSEPNSLTQITNSEDWSKSTFENGSLSESVWNFQKKEIKSVINRLEENSVPLDQITAAIGRGTSTGNDDVFELQVEKQRDGIVSCSSQVETSPVQIETEVLRTPIHSTDFGKYYFTNSDGKKIIWPYDSNYNLISEDVFASRYPNAWNYLQNHKQSLENRADYAEWYDYSAPRNLSMHDHAEILIPLLADSPSFSEYPKPQSKYVLMASGGFGISLQPESDYSPTYVLSLINSRLLFLYLESISNIFRGGWITCTKQYFKHLPIREINFTTLENKRETLVEEAIEAYNDYFETESTNDMKSVLTLVENHLAGQQERADVVHDLLVHLVGEITDLHTRYQDLNLSLLDHLGTYDEGPILTEIGFAQPPTGISESILSETTETRTKLGITDVFVERDEPNRVTVSAEARYKPDDPADYETDSNDYRYVGPFEALHITDLTEREADLIEAFVPVAVDEEMAGFRKNAAKTISPIDRLEKVTLPQPDDVADGVERYRRTKSRADELDEKIEKTDELIDEIVYELYGLTDEEIEIVEEAVSD